MKGFALILILLICSSFKKYEELKIIGCVKLDIMLVADMSQSVSGYEKFIHDAFKSFVDRFELDDNGIRMGLIRFSSDAYLLTELTTDKKNLYSGLETIKPYTADGTTNLTHALYLANNEILENGRVLAGKIIVVITDGDPDDDESAYEAAQVIKSFPGTNICGIYISSPYSDKDFLKLISSEFCYVESNYDNLVKEIQKLDVCL